MNGSLLRWALFAISIGALFPRDAAGAPAAPAKEPAAVLLVVAASPRDASEFGQVASELLARLDVRLEIRRVTRIDLRDVARPRDSASRYVARAFVDLRVAERAVLWLVDAEQDRVLIREVDHRSTRELAQEELGHILATSTEGLLAGARIGVPRAEVLPLLEPEPEAEAKPKPTPTRADASPPGWRWQATLVYELQAISGSAPLTHGPEAAALLRLPPAPRLGFGVAGRYRAPSRFDGSPVGARTEGGAVLGFAALDVPLARKLAARFDLGGGVELVELRPEGPRTDGVTLAEQRLLAFPIGRLAAALELRASPWLSLLFRAGADLDPSGRRYVFDTIDGEELVLSPWPVRPTLAAGVGFP